MERKATRKENKEMDENKVIVSTEMKQTLVNLRNLEEIYVIMSGVTKMPFDAQSPRPSVENPHR